MRKNTLAIAFAFVLSGCLAQAAFADGHRKSVRHVCHNCSGRYIFHPLYGAYGPYGGVGYWGAYASTGWGYR